MLVRIRERTVRTLRRGDEGALSLAPPYGRARRSQRRFLESVTAGHGFCQHCLHQSPLCHHRLNLYFKSDASLDVVFASATAARKKTKTTFKPVQEGCRCVTDAAVTHHLHHRLLRSCPRLYYSRRRFRRACAQASARRRYTSSSLLKLEVEAEVREVEVELVPHSEHCKVCAMMSSSSDSTGMAPSSQHSGASFRSEKNSLGTEGVSSRRSSLPSRQMASSRRASVAEAARVAPDARTIYILCSTSPRLALELTINK